MMYYHDIIQHWLKSFNTIFDSFLYALMFLHYLSYFLSFPPFAGVATTQQYQQKKRLLHECRGGLFFCPFPAKPFPFGGCDFN